MIAVPAPNRRYPDALVYRVFLGGFSVVVHAPSGLLALRGAR